MATKIVVQIPGATKTYTYVCHGPVKVDDRVAVPGPPWAPDDEQAGTVVEVGSSYAGQLRVAKGDPVSPEMQVKQYVAEVNGAPGFRFRVFRTGSARHYLFVCTQNSDIQVPVLKSDLNPEVRRALAAGVGHASR